MLRAVLLAPGLIVALGVSLAANGVLAEEMPDFAKEGRPFLEKHCVQCHSGKEPKGEISLEAFRDGQSIVRQRKVWDTVLKKIQAGEMPPPDKPQPSATESAAFVAHTAAVFDFADKHAKPDPGRVTCRWRRRSRN